MCACMLLKKEIFPSEIQSLIGVRPIETNDVGRSHALVAMIGNDLVLKRTEKGKLQNAYLMQSFFHRHDLAPEAVYYLSDDFDYLVSARALGKSAIDEENLRHPARLAAAMGEFLLKVHSLPAPDCPVQNLMDGFLNDFDIALLKNEGVYAPVADFIGIKTLSEASEVVSAARGLFQNDTVLHGDYCLPNIMLENLTGRHLIDVGEGGVGDRHFDLFWGLWSLCYNLKTPAYGEAFLSAYGKNRVDLHLIHACGCLCAQI